MKRILVCITGGTFSAKTQNSVMDVTDGVIAMIREKADIKYHQSAVFEYIKPVFMLSENLIPEDWETITAGINAAIAKDRGFDGIIVIHGSDTVPYTASFLCWYYAGLSIPLVVTASNAPLGEPRANGWQNFFASVDFVLNGEYSGVYFIYRSGQSQEMFVFAAEELREADVYSGEFSSGTPYVFGKMENGQLIGRDQRRKKTASERWEFEPFVYTHKVLGIKPYPGLDYQVFSFKQSDIKAVVHQSYHSNTYNCRLENETDRYSLLAFLKECDKNEITVYLSDFPKERLIAPLYETTIRLIRQGAIPIFLPFEAAYTRAVYAYNQKNVSPETFMIRTV